MLQMFEMITIIFELLGHYLVNLSLQYCSARYPNLDEIVLRFHIVSFHYSDLDPIPCDLTLQPIKK